MLNFLTKIEAETLVNRLSIKQYHEKTKTDSKTKQKDLWETGALHGCRKKVFEGDDREKVKETGTMRKSQGQGLRARVGGQGQKN